MLLLGVFWVFLSCVCVCVCARLSVSACSVCFASLSFMLLLWWLVVVVGLVEFGSTILKVNVILGGHTGQDTPDLFLALLSIQEPA